MSAPHFRGVAPPDGHAPPVYDVVGAGRGDVLDLTILDEMMLGVAAHWLIDPVNKRGRSVLCYSFEGACPHCGKHRGIWLGFAAVYNHTSRQRQVLRVGPEGAKKLATFSAAGDGLRGRRLCVSVATTGRVGGLDVRLSQDGPVYPIPAAHNIVPTVCLVLSCQYIPEYRRSASEIKEEAHIPPEGGYA